MNPPVHVTDRLLTAIEEKGSPVCVGLDPNPALMPKEFVTDGEDPTEQLEQVGRFCTEVLQIIAPYAPAVKPQIAYFEALPAPQRFFGMAIYSAVIRLARQMGFVVIGDAKRGDIGSTAEAYATAHLRGEDAPDFLTVNGYFGADGLEPFLAACREGSRGVFVLVRTSNPSAKTIQDFPGSNGRPFYEHLARQVAEIGSAEGLVGSRGYSAVGAVVGATYPDEARTLRQIMPEQLFLLPGYGQQGATAEDCAAAFKPDGTGAIVNAARSVIYAHRRDEHAGKDWKTALADAARDFASDIATALRS